MTTLIQTESSPIRLPFAFISSSPEETFALALRLVPLLEKGSIIALRGPLGAGKTCFAKGAAKGLGVEEEVTSPTYTIVSEYEGKLSPAFETETIKICHIDAYRLSGEEDFSEIGGEEIIFGNGISIIEWSEKISGLIPPEAIMVDIEIREDGKRSINIYRNI